MTTASTRVHDDLWERVALGDQSARNEIVERNLPLVQYVVGRMNLTGQSASLDFDDLVAFGQIGLIDAVERFDPGIGTKFSTYAVRRIRGTIMDELRAMDWAPRSVRRKQRQVERAARELRQEHGRHADIEELARRANMTPEEVEQALEEARLSYTTSLDGYVDPGASSDGSVDNGAMQQKDLVGEEYDDPEQHGMMLEHRTRIAAALGSIGEQARTFFALYYFEDRSLSEIGAILGVSESRVCQVHTAAMRELRVAV